CSAWTRGGRSERRGIGFEIAVPIHLIAGVPGIPGIGGSRAYAPAGLWLPCGTARVRTSTYGAVRVCTLPCGAVRGALPSSPLGRPFCSGCGSSSTACAFCEFREIAVPGQLLHR